MMEAGQHFFHGIPVLGKGGLQAFMLTVMPVEKFNKVQQVGGIESPVFEMEELFQVSIGMTRTELIRRLIHQAHQFVGFIDNRGPVAPGKNGSKETRDFDILFFPEAVGDRDGVRCNKSGLVVQPYLFI